MVKSTFRNRASAWAVALAVVVSAGALSGEAAATTLVLEGSDATTFHDETNYTSQLFGYLSEGSTLPVLVFGDQTMAGAPASTVYTMDLSGLSISNYSALYIQSPGGCCDDNRTGALSFEAQIAGFVSAGGSLAIQDYQGGDWGDILSFVAPASAIGGLGGGAGGPGCFDTEIVTPLGTARGFTQPPVLGCWGHQAYDMDYFGALGFVNLIDSGPEFDAIGSGNWSSFIALGGTLGSPGAVPEPGTWLMMLLGFAGTGIALRRSRKAGSGAVAQIA